MLRKLVDNLIKELKKILKENPLDKFDWDIPDNCPIHIPEGCVGSYSRNIYLKDNLRKTIYGDKSLDTHYWVINDWGGIKSFKKNEKNNNRIKNFLVELDKNVLTRDSFRCISSLSKVASFINSDSYAIYDSRVIYSLNWLIFNYTNQIELFPQPIGRGFDLAKYEMQTIFRLTKRQYSYKSYKVSFHQYCELLKKLTVELFGQHGKLYNVEMLLFMIAPTKIVNQIESSVSLTINIQ
jgi:hypothetical protein